MIKRIYETAFQNAENCKIVSEKLDLKVISTMILVAFCLTMTRYLTDYHIVVDCFYNLGLYHYSSSLKRFVNEGNNAQLHSLIYWALITIFFYIIPPIILIKFIFKEKLNSYGLGFQNAFSEYKIYLIMLLVMIPLVLFFSRTTSFQQRYPFYSLRKGESIYPNLLLWECVYFIQFFALEFFFRGFLLHGMKSQLGYYSVFAMTIPYCMIHFTKPLPETLAAIIAGIVLGTLSLKSNSIWLGVFIHCTVALSMDICSIYHKGILF